MTITLPDDLRAGVEARAKAKGFDDPGEYIADLVAADEFAEALATDPALRARLMAAAVEGLESPPIDDPDQFLADLARVAAGGEWPEAGRP